MRVRYKPVCCGDETKKSYSFKDFFESHLNSFILLFSVITLTLLYLAGILTYLFEEDFSNYSYPIDIGDVRNLVEKIDTFQVQRQHQNLVYGLNIVNYDSIVEALDYIKENDHPIGVAPLTQFRNFNFSIDINPTCRSQWGINQIQSTLLSLSSQQHLITVIIVVKSAVNNYARRQAIRNSWYLNQTKELFAFKTVFMVGKCHEQNIVPASTAQLNSKRSWSANDCNERILNESSKFGDIVQSSGIDSYYNNTIKTYMTLRWLNERCPADFSLAIDDDYVFEVDNFISFMYDYASSYLTSPKAELDDASSKPATTRNGSFPNSLAESTTHSMSNGARYSTSMEISNSNSKQGETRSSYASPALDFQVRNLIALRRMSKQYVWAGYMRNYVHPIRSVFSKWYISRDEYAFNKYPPFITGGYVLMSFKTIKHLYYTTYFTRSFKFDDVYLGILAYKLGLNALHSENFMCSMDDYMDANPIRSNSTECIAVHDIEPRQLEELWQTRREHSLV